MLYKNNIEKIINNPKKLSEPTQNQYKANTFFGWF